MAYSDSLLHFLSADPPSPTNADTRAQIEAQTERYLSAGGEIQQIENGLSQAQNWPSKPTRKQIIDHQKRQSFLKTHEWKRQ